MKKLLFFAAGLIFLTACGKNEEPFLPTFYTDQVNFSDLKVGQKSLYRAYQANCADMNGTFEWTGDTLILETISGEEGFFLQESFTIHSPRYDEDIPPTRYALTKIDSGILLPERQASLLFYFYANDTLRLNPSHDITLQQDECFLTSEDGVFVGNDIGFVPSFQVGDAKVTEKTAVSCEPFFDLDGYLIYDNESLYVSHVVDLISFGTTIQGFYLIEK